MISVRVALFVTSLLGFMYAVLSVTNQAKTDTAAGMIVAAVGIVGWAVMDWIEERR